MFEAVLKEVSAPALPMRRRTDRKQLVGVIRKSCVEARKKEREDHESHG